MTNNQPTVLPLHPARIFLLYAKGRLPKSNNPFDDLRILLGFYTESFPKDISITDIFTVLWDVTWPFLLERPKSLKDVVFDLIFDAFKYIEYAKPGATKPVSLTTQINLLNLCEKLLGILDTTATKNSHGETILNLGQPKQRWKVALSEQTGL